MEFLKNPNYDFLGKTKIAVALSLTLLLAGSAYVATRGVRYGVEFSGGTQLIARFQSRPEVEKVRAAVDRVTAGSTIQTFDDPSKNSVLIRLPQRGDATEDLGADAAAVLKSLAANYPGNPVVE